MTNREQFQQWWEKNYQSECREPWNEIYVPEHDYYVYEEIDVQYSAWKGGKDSARKESNDDNA